MLDTKTNQVTGAATTVGSQPFAVAIASNAKRAYVSNYADGTVSVINIAPNVLVKNENWGTPRRESSG
jgi:DNA-binding beta-propeller fold protein YncE